MNLVFLKVGRGGSEGRGSTFSFGAGGHVQERHPDLQVLQPCSLARVHAICIATCSSGSFPIHIRLLQQFPESSGCPKCKASFSLISSNTRIPAHAGPTNSRLRAHLGLVVPKKGEVNIRVGNQTVGWKPGKWTVIDDSFEHEVVNNGNGPRLILLVDFRHPDVGRSEGHREEFNWSKEDMTTAGLARSGSVRGGFPESP